MTPRTEALAFRIWQYADPRGWNCTAGEIAAALSDDETRFDARRIGKVCQVKGWGGRLRVSEKDNFYGGTYNPVFGRDALLSGTGRNEIIAQYSSRHEVAE